MGDADLEKSGGGIVTIDCRTYSAESHDSLSRTEWLENQRAIPPANGA